MYIIGVGLSSCRGDLYSRRGVCGDEEGDVLRMMDSVRRLLLWGIFRGSVMLPLIG